MYVQSYDNTAEPGGGGVGGGTSTTRRELSPVGGGGGVKENERIQKNEGKINYSTYIKIAYNSEIETNEN